MAEVRAYKVTSLNGIKPNSIVALKVPNESKFELYISDLQGVPYPLNIPVPESSVTSITNTDGNLTVTGSSTVVINVSPTILNTINSALQAGDNISELVNDAGYITVVDVPIKTSELINDGENGNPFLDINDIGDVATSNDYNDLDNLPTIPSGVTNLGYISSPTQGIVTSDTGTDSIIPPVDYTNAGLQTPSDKQLEYNNASTGLISFDGLSINADNTKFDIGLIKGWFVDNTTNPEIPTKTYVDFPPFLANTVTNIATQNVTYIAIDALGVIQQSGIPFEPEQQRDWIPLGVIVHSNRTTINAVNNQPVVALSPNNQISDLMESIGVFNISGNVFSPNGANLNINKSAGHIFKQGSNFLNNNKDPHTLVLNALVAPSNIRYRLQDGTESADTNVISPNFWDNAGVLTAMTGTRWSIQRIYLFQSNLVRIQYGQATYANQAEAIQSIPTETFTVEQNLLENGLFRGLLIVRRNATNLTDTSRALFIEAGKFGSVAGLGSLSTTSLQQAYNNSLTPEIVTDSTLGAVSIKRGSASDTDNVLEVQDGTGAITATIKGNGEISGSNLSGTNTGDNATNTTSNSYADAKVADAINDGITTIAPSQNAVYDALVLKFDNPTGTGTQYLDGEGVPKDFDAVELAVDTTPITSGTDGRILFQKANKVSQNANLFWDDTNSRLGINQTIPTSKLHVKASDATTTPVFQVENSAGGTFSLKVLGNGSVFNNGAGGISSNMAFGLNALRANTIGTGNTAYGENALYANTTGTANLAIGQNTLLVNTTGNGNTAIGGSSLFNNTTGGGNLAIGGGGLSANTTGSNNTTIGTSALRRNIDGSDNIAIGKEAGSYYGAVGFVNATSSDYSMFIGGNARPLLDNQFNQIVIGQDAVGAGSNTATLGHTSIVDTILRGRINLTQYATGSRPTYVKGALIYDSTLGKLVIGGNSGWEVVTSI